MEERGLVTRIDRLEATRLVTELVGDAPIIGSVGNATFDLSAFDRPANFYIWNSMGMASSIALGLALARPDCRVVILDGDGALLMNLGSLATAAMAGVQNVVHIVWDNGSWDITGGQPAGSSFGIDFEMIARGCGFTRTADVRDLESLRRAVTDAMNDLDRWFIVARVAPGSSSHRPSKNLSHIRDRTRAAVAAIPRNAASPSRAMSLSSRRIGEG
jgi:phosphonopyruvate decarboxylase